MVFHWRDASRAILVFWKPMGIFRTTRNNLVKFLFGDDSVPRGLFELDQYFRQNGPIGFDYKQEDGLIVAVSTNFRFGSIVTYGKDEHELDRKIKDAILTSFEVPSSYAKEAGIIRMGDKEGSYALT
jgi:hypothetical protein